MSRADERHDVTIDQYITSIDDEVTRQDSKVLFEMMHRISGEEPILYGIGTIGFGVYDYRYESGREGESHTLAFYPRKGKITVYLTDGTERYVTQLSDLGEHTTTGYCLYIKRLSDIKIPVLELIITMSYANIAALAKDGPIRQIPWQTA